MEELPTALSSLYALPSPNQPLELFVGRMLVGNNLFSAEGKGRIFLSWHPKKQVVFEIVSSFNAAQTFGSKVEILLEGWASRMPGELLRLEHFFKDGMAGTKFFGCLSPLAISHTSAPPSSNHVIFHLANFEDGGSGNFITRKDGRRWAGRHQLESKDWLITLDSLKVRISEKLEKEGGYCVTHIGRLEQRNSKSFEASTARDMLEALTYYLSFCRGLWIPAFLPLGFSDTSQILWREWTSPAKASSWQSVNPSFRTTPFSPTTTFSRFLERWNSETWHEPIKRCIHWYVESSLKAGGVEGSIIITAAAFELLAWVLFFEDQQHKKFDNAHHFNKKVNAAAKLNLLLDWAGASTRLSARYAILEQFAKQRKWNNNGAEIFLGVRNSLTHSSPEHRQIRTDIPSEALYQAYLLGLHYLKGFLQKLFDHPMPFVKTVTIRKS